MNWKLWNILHKFWLIFFLLLSTFFQQSKIFANLSTHFFLVGSSDACAISANCWFIFDLLVLPYIKQMFASITYIHIQVSHYLCVCVCLDLINIFLVDLWYSIAQIVAQRLRRVAREKWAQSTVAAIIMQTTQWQWAQLRFLRTLYKTMMTI